MHAPLENCQAPVKKGHWHLPLHVILCRQHSKRINAKSAERTEFAPTSEFYIVFLKCTRVLHLYYSSSRYFLSSDLFTCDPPIALGFLVTAANASVWERLPFAKALTAQWAGLKWEQGSGLAPIWRNGLEWHRERVEGVSLHTFTVFSIPSTVFHREVFHKWKKLENKTQSVPPVLPSVLSPFWLLLPKVIIFNEISQPSKCDFWKQCRRVHPLGRYVKTNKQKLKTDKPIFPMNICSFIKAIASGNEAWEQGIHST